MSLAHYEAEDNARWSMYRPEFAERVRKKRLAEKNRQRAIEIAEANKRRQKQEFERRLANAQAERDRAKDIAERDRIRREMEGHEALPTCASIMAKVSILTGFTIAELRSKQRMKPLVLARQFAYWRCKKETGQSLPEIGRRFKDGTGKRDHTTVLHGVRKIEKLIAAGDKQVLAWIAEAGL